MEPQEYFESLKSKVQSLSSDRLQDMLRRVEDELVRAHAIGQTSMVERLVFSRDAIAREIDAHAAGTCHYVYKEAIAEFIDSVEPAGSVKIIELDRYPRIIPEKNMREIKYVKDKGIFDAYCVVFTDLTNESIETQEDIAFRDRNRDPIVFGYFEKPNTSIRGDRFYLVTDWEDEFCDLTFDRLIERLSDPKAHGRVDPSDPKELQRIINDSLAKETKQKTVGQATIFLNRLKKWIKLT